MSLSFDDKESFKEATESLFHTSSMPTEQLEGQPEERSDSARSEDSEDMIFKQIIVQHPCTILPVYTNNTMILPN